MYAFLAFALGMAAGGVAGFVAALLLTANDRAEQAQRECRDESRRLARPVPRVAEAHRRQADDRQACGGGAERNAPTRAC